jgi:hypothetical protein
MRHLFLLPDRKTVPETKTFSTLPGPQAFLNPEGVFQELKQGRRSTPSPFARESDVLFETRFAKRFSYCNQTVSKDSARGQD